MRPRVYGSWTLGLDAGIFGMAPGLFFLIPDTFLQSERVGPISHDEHACLELWVAPPHQAQEGVYTINQLQDPFVAVFLPEEWIA